MSKTALPIPRALTPVLAVLVVLLACAETETGSGELGGAVVDSTLVTRQSMGDEWPLTVESGRVGCDEDGRVYFEDEDGTRYGLTGFAAQEYGEIDPIWADAEPGPKARLTALTERARSYCPE